MGEGGRYDAAVDKLERLLNLTMTLLSTERPLRAEEIRERVLGYPDKLESFRRAFERDKDDLREMGIPIQLVPVDGTDPPAEGYRIRPEDYYLRDPGLEPDELAALHFALEAVSLGGERQTEAIWKLGGVVGDQPTDSGPLVALPADPNLATLFDATSRRAAVTMTYHAEARRIDPYRLELRRGWWYLIGFDHNRGEVRNYRVDRIEGAVTQGSAGAFERPALPAPGVAQAGWQLPTGEAVPTTVVVDADQSGWFRQQLGTEVEATDRGDGSTQFVLPVTNWPAFRSFVLTFLDHIEVTAPPAARADMVAWLEAMAGAS